MMLDQIVGWLNANPGAATVAAAVVAVVLSGVGWLVAQPFRASTKNLRPSAHQVAGRADSESGLDDVMDRKAIKVGVLDYPPLMTFTRDDRGSTTATGIYPRLISKFAKEEGIAVEWVVLNWSEIIDSVKQGRVHLVASVFWTPKRSEHATFCAMLHRIATTGIVRSDEARIETHEDLKRGDLKIGVVRGEIGWEYSIDMLNLAFESKRFKVLDQVDVRSAAELVENLVVDVVLADSLSCWLAIQQASERGITLKQVFVNDQLYTCDSGIMIKRDDTRLRDWLERGVRKWRNDPELLAAEDSQLAGLKQIVKKRDP